MKRWIVKQSFIVVGALIGLILLPVGVKAMSPTDDVGEVAFGDRATFVLVGGEVIEDVPFEVNERFKVVTLDLDGDERNISFNEIESILIDGTGVTAQILGGSRGGAPAQASASAPSLHDPVYKKVRSSLFKVALGLSANYSLPTTDYYEGIDGGIGFGGDFLIGLKRDIALRLSVSRAGLQGESGPYAFRDPYSEGIVQITDFDFTATRFILGVQYHKHFKPQDTVPSLVYGFTGIGFIDQDSASEGYFFEDEYDETGTPIFGEYSETKFLTNLGVGVVLPLNDRVGIDLLANMDMLWLGSTGEGYYYSTQHAYIFDFRAGLIWFIP